MASSASPLPDDGRPRIPHGVAAASGSALPLAFQLHRETSKDFAESIEAAACLRLRKREGQADPERWVRTGLPVLAFAASTRSYDISAAGGALLRSRATNGPYGAAVCVGHVMATGRHAAEFTIVKGSQEYSVGITWPSFDREHEPCWHTITFWALSSCGYTVHASRCTPTVRVKRGGTLVTPALKFTRGDVIGLLLDCDTGTLTVKKNGVRIGESDTGLTGEIFWSAFGRVQKYASADRGRRLGNILIALVYKL